jgi:hypothetical protein
VRLSHPTHMEVYAGAIFTFQGRSRFQIGTGCGVRVKGQSWVLLHLADDAVVDELWRSVGHLRTANLRCVKAGEKSLAACKGSMTACDSGGALCSCSEGPLGGFG